MTDGPGGRWLWPVGPEFYMDAKGRDRETLDPARGVDPGSWWACHPDTRRGDLLLLWRASPRHDIAYLAQAASDAYRIAEGQPGGLGRWSFGCDYRAVHRIAIPLPIAAAGLDLPDDAGRQPGIRLTDEQWTRLTGLLDQRDRYYVEALAPVEAGLSALIREDEEILETLAQNLELLRPYGYELEPVEIPGQAGPGRQIVCAGQGGRIDLLCYDRRGKRYVAIEASTLRAGLDTLRQLESFLTWLAATHPTRRAFFILDTPTPSHGLIVSRGCTEEFTAATERHRAIKWIDIRHLVRR